MIFQSPEFSVAYCQGCVYLSMKSNNPVIERFEDDLELDWDVKDDDYDNNRSDTGEESPSHRALYRRHLHKSS